jgi:hypothetical protein
MTVTQYQDAIERLASQGRPLAEIEDLIDDAPALSEEQKSALWLLAWTHQATRSHRRMVRKTLLLAS